MKAGPPLTLHPRACDRCGSCLEACEREALKVGRTYLKVDWSRCDGCGACARVCAHRAIVMTGASRQRAASADRARPAARHAATEPRARTATQTPRARSARALAAGRKANDRASTTPRPVKGGQRGGFQWTLLEAAAMLSVTFSAFTLKEVAPLLPAFKGLPAPLATPFRVGMLAVYYLIQVLVLIWLVRRRQGEPLVALGLRAPQGAPRRILSSAAYVAMVLVATRLITSLYAYVTRELGLMPSASVDLPTLFGADAAGFALAVVMVVLVGPVAEEAVFRGALLEGLAARFGAWPAIVIQALLFAAFHRSVWMLFPTFVLGFALGWLAHTRGSLWPSIVVHGLYNAITVGLAFLVA